MLFGFWKDIELADMFKYFGWENGWEKVPHRVRQCHKKDHPVVTIQRNKRGSDNTVYCTICRYYYKFDKGNDNT